MMRKALAIFVLLLGSLCAAAAAEPPAQPFLHLKRGPVVQRVSHKEATVVWRTLGKSVPRVTWGETPDRLSWEVSGERIAESASCWAEITLPKGVFVTGPMIRAYRGGISDTGGTYQYAARLTGLRPATTYYYAVYHGDTRIAGGTKDHFFRTAPAPGTPARVRFWVVGDSGTGGLVQALVHGAARRRAAADGRAFDFMLQVGGLAAAGGRGHLAMARYFDSCADILRSTPCWPVLGRGDPEGAVLDSFVLPAKGECGGVPSGEERYYAFEWGRVHVVALYAPMERLEPGRRKAMLDWLKRDLAAAGAARKAGRMDCVVAVVYDSPLAEIKVRRKTLANRVKTDLMPLLREGGADVVFFAGTGNYQRSGPGERPVLVGVGNGGAPMRKPAAPLPEGWKVVVEHGSLIVDVGGDALNAVLVDRNGQVRDTFTLHRGEAR